MKSTKKSWWYQLSWAPSMFINQVATQSAWSAQLAWTYVQYAARRRNWSWHHGGLAKGAAGTKLVQPKFFPAPLQIQIQYTLSSKTFRPPCSFFYCRSSETSESHAGPLSKAPYSTNTAAVCLPVLQYVLRAIYLLPIFIPIFNVMCLPTAATEC